MAQYTSMRLRTRAQTTRATRRTYRGNTTGCYW
eukprot:COSAG05_NODE_22745_length_262_cov_1.883436_1_plen_32_part_01